MALFEVEFYGLTIDVKASSVTKKQAEHIRTYMKAKGYEFLFEADKELKYLGVDVNKADLFDFYKILYYDELTVRVLDFEYEEVLKFKFKEMASAPDTMPDFDKKYNDSPFIISNYKQEGEGLLLTVDTEKVMFPCIPFESDDVPTIKDFAYSLNTLQSPNDTWEYINRIFFKGQNLDISTYTNFRKIDRFLKLY